VKAQELRAMLQEQSNAQMWGGVVEYVSAAVHRRV
jgi:hypothetical protein